MVIGTTGAHGLNAQNHADRELKPKEEHAPSLNMEEEHVQAMVGHCFDVK